MRSLKKILTSYRGILLVLFFNVSLVCTINSQAYSNYEVSHNSGELSFEAIPVYYASELRTTRKFLKTRLKEDLNSNFITEAFLNYRILKKQLKYVEQEGYDLDLLRICDSTFVLQPLDIQKKHKRIISHLEKTFSISKTEYDVLKSTIVFSRNQADNQNLIEYINLFEEYIDVAYELKYSKLEIFRDFTGYWKPEAILHKTSFRQVFKACMNWKHFKNIYKDPLDYLSRTREQGLKPKEAIRRLRDINKSRG